MEYISETIKSENKDYVTTQILYLIGILTPLKQYKRHKQYKPKHFLPRIHGKNTEINSSEPRFIPNELINVSCKLSKS